MIQYVVMKDGVPWQTVYESEREQEILRKVLGTQSEFPGSKIWLASPPNSPKVEHS